MDIFSHFNFARQLIFYFVIVLIAAFGFISWTLTNSVKHFIGNNTYTQAQIFAENIQITFEKEMLELENIPDKIIKTSGYCSMEYISTLPEIVLNNYPQVLSCSLHCNISNPDTTTHNHLIALRNPNGEIKLNKPRYCTFRPPTQEQIIHQARHGYWIHSNIRQEKTIAFCYPLYGNAKHPLGFLKLDFPYKTITNFICNHKLYKYGYLFIIDSAGNYLVPPFQQGTVNLSQFAPFPYLKQKITQGGTKTMIYKNKNIPYFVHYTSIPYINWYLGIVCPSYATLNSSNKLYWIIFICLGGGLLFLFIGTINIVHRLSYPLKQLAYTARQIADGKFDTPIPRLKCSHEIHELYNSFRYLQHNLINYIEKLKISTAEKEQRNSEMNLAQKIQQRFLPHHITLPSHIELAAELRQSREVGGDLYEFFIRENRLYFAIGDVSGKGVPAALYMVSISKLFRYVACTLTSTAQICNTINQHMCEDTEDDMYITMFMGILDINTGILTYTNAGHPYPLVIHDNGTSHFLDKCPDMPIGILENHCFTEHTYTLPKNNTLLFYTDGITDTENPAGQFFGKEKLIRCAEKMAASSPQQIIQAILEDITQHIDTHKQTDDLTLLLIRFKGIS